MLGMNAVYGIQYFMKPMVTPRPHREQALLASNRQDCVVTLGASPIWVDKHVNGLVEDGYGGLLGKHDVEEFAFENLLT